MKISLADARHLPLEIQQEAFQKGDIPYAPALKQKSKDKGVSID